MAESPAHLKDGGISEILMKSESKQTENETPNSEEISASQGRKEIESDFVKGDKVKSSNDDQISNGKEPDSVSIRSRNGRTSPQSYTEELDLTDPNSVMEMLENVDLTEEDTEDLLQEAYNMNKKLKEMLRRQEMESASSKPKLKSRSKSNTDSRMYNGQGSYSSTASSSGNNSRNGSSFGIRKVLPPITQGDKQSSVYAIQLRRSKTNIPDTRTQNDTTVLRTRSSTKPNRKESESPTRRRKPPGPKPEWNDRFNFS